MPYNFDWCFITHALWFVHCAYELIAFIYGKKRQLKQKQEEEELDKRTTEYNTFTFEEKKNRKLLYLYVLGVIFRLLSSLYNITVCRTHFHSIHNISMNNIVGDIFTALRATTAATATAAVYSIFLYIFVIYDAGV